MYWYELYELYSNKRVFLRSYVVLTALMVIIVVFSVYSYRRFSFEGETLRLVRVTHDTVTAIDSDGNKAVLTITGGQSWFRTPESASVIYRDRVITRDVSTDTESRGFGLIFVYSFSEDDLTERALMRQMLAYHAEGRTIWRYIIISLLLTNLLMLFGLFTLIFPKIRWEMQTFMYVRDGEPTDFYYFTTFVCGIIFICGSFIILILVLP